MEAKYSNLIGLSYETHNCWDIAVLFYKNVLGLDLSHFHDGSGVPDREITRNIIFTRQAEFEKVSVPKFGDIVILKLFGIECHIAIYLGHGKILHTTRTSGSVIDRIEKWKRVVVGYYRAKQDK